ncbi:MAG: 50S ribosomal protein L4 [Kiritimatiellales bacterium]|nr:50S ribosomal protein L4 [Kiritimatiellales bacterium]
MSKVPFKNCKGESIGEFDVADSLLIADKGDQAVTDAIVAYNAHQRAGTASTLTKAEVHGTGAKPWKQKGLGRARAGYKQSPIWRGGGVAHGPHPRKYGKKLSKKVSRLAFRRAFSEKIAEGQVTMIDELMLSAPKTKEFTTVIKGLELARGVLFILDSIEENVQLASRNIPQVEVVTAQLVNTYQLLRYPNVVITKAGMEVLEKRLA